MKRIIRRDQLVELAKELRVRPDWHEPDEQLVTARVQGTEFDTAMGPAHWYGTEHDGVPRAEMYVVLYQAEDEGREPEAKAAVGLATLFAWATGYELCTCSTVSSFGDPESGDREDDPRCPEHGQLAQTVDANKWWERNDRQLRRLLGMPETAEPFGEGMAVLDAVRKLLSKASDGEMYLRKVAEFAADKAKELE